MSAKNNTQVVIDGKVFTLCGYEEEEYLNKVASYINNKILELKQSEGFRRQNKETQNTLIHLNIADDYYKAKKQADLLEMELEDKNKELYEIKHDLISLQIKTEAAEKELEKFRKEVAEYEKKIVKLETELISEQKKK
ncbi:MAG: cell division protein ZapA [Lachnospiraceae bacterium]|nr:cell division protein ZapA [Lachnospiraceae bacterium]